MRRPEPSSRGGGQPDNRPPLPKPLQPGAQLGRSQDRAVVNAASSASGSVNFPGRSPRGRLGTTLERKNSRKGRVRASAWWITALGRPSCLTKVPGESTNPCTH